MGGYGISRVFHVPANRPREILVKYPPMELGGNIIQYIVCASRLGGSRCVLVLCVYCEVCVCVCVCVYCVCVLCVCIVCVLCVCVLCSLCVEFASLVWVKSNSMSHHELLQAALYHN